MKRLLIIAACLFIPLYIFTWSRFVALSYTTSITKIFGLIFCIKFFIILLLLNERFFIKNRNVWVTILFGLIASSVLGAVIWVDSRVLFENGRLGVITMWNQMSWYQFIIHYMLPASIYGSCSIITGVLSAVSTRYLLNKFKVFKANSDQ